MQKRYPASGYILKSNGIIKNIPATVLLFPGKSLCFTANRDEYTVQGLKKVY